MDFIDPTMPIIGYLERSFGDQAKSFRSFKAEAGAPLPCVRVKTVGASTVQLIVRADEDVEAFELCTEIANYLKRNGHQIDGINIFDISLQTPIYPSVDEDTHKDEAWCYLSINYFEN